MATIQSNKPTTKRETKMTNSTKANTYKITFAGEQPMTMAKAEINSPTILKAIGYIESETGCSGLTLQNGIKIEKA